MNVKEKGLEREQPLETLAAMTHMGEHIPGGFFIYRADEKEELLYANDLLCDIYGCKDIEEFKEWTGFTFQGMVYPEDFSSVHQMILEQVKESERNLDSVEYRIMRKDGEIRWVDDFGRLVETEDFGKVYTVFLRDITELHFNREENQRRMGVIEGLSLDYTSIYLFHLDTRDFYPYWQGKDRFRILENEAGIKEGEVFSCDQILPVYVKRYVLPEDRMLYTQETMVPRIRKRLERERSYTVHYRSISGDKITYMEMFIAHIESDENGTQVVMGYRDVTEHILQEQEVLAHKLNIEMELEREKYSNEIKSSFLFNISHDIRTPMNAIMGFTDLAIRHVEDTEALKRYLLKVRESNQHMMALIDDLLEMSQMDYGRIEMDPEPCNLEENIRLVLDLYYPQAEKKGVFLVENLVLPEERVYVDAAYFRKMLGNLINNAVKFTPKDGMVKVSAKQKEKTDGVGTFLFVIADSGIGMKKEFMSRMFSAFEREENATESGYEGAGLGLAITKHLLDAMGGIISVESKKGEGSTFTLEIPFPFVGEGAETGTEQEGKEVEISRRVSKQRRILLVEDIEMNRILEEELLFEEGFLVESVPDGSVAVQAVKEHEPWYYDLILMDIQMPVMNGYEAAKQIRSMGREDTGFLPIIALSANAHEEDKKKSKESGMNSHVAKPFNVEHLVRTINKYLG